MSHYVSSLTPQLEFAEGAASSAEAAARDARAALAAAEGEAAEAREALAAREARLELLEGESATGLRPVLQHTR